MSCVSSSNPTYGPRTMVGQLMIFMTEAQFDSYPALLIEQAGFDCDTAYNYVRDNIYAGVVSGTGIQILRNGAVVPALTDEMVTLGDVIGGGFCAWDGEVVGTYEKSITDGFNSTVPASVAGVSFIGQMNLQPSFGDPFPTLTIPLGEVLTGLDYDKWFCCATASIGCDRCGGGGGARTGFLIPRPAVPEIGDENISTPPFELPLYLSNYTAQFTNNFGRVKKI